MAALASVLTKELFVLLSDGKIKRIDLLNLKQESNISCPVGCCKPLHFPSSLIQFHGNVLRISVCLQMVSMYNCAKIYYWHYSNHQTKINIHLAQSAFLVSLVRTEGKEMLQRKHPQEQFLLTRHNKSICIQADRFSILEPADIRRRKASDLTGQGD